MKRESIENFLLHNAGCFEERDIKKISQGLAMVPDEMAIHLLGCGFKHPGIAQVLSVFGVCGVDRFYLGQPLLGLLKLFTFAGFGLWYLFDLVMIQGAARSCNSDKLVSLINTYAEKSRPTQERATDSTMEGKVTTSVAVVEKDPAETAEVVKIAKTPGSENPMDYAPKESDYSQYAPK